VEYGVKGHSRFSRNAASAPNQRNSVQSDSPGLSGVSILRNKGVIDDSTTIPIDPLQFEVTR